MKNKGFTLIEILIVVGIMVTLGFIFTDIFLQTLRGGNKVNTVNRVKQNGQVVLDQLTNEIRQADKIVCTGNFSIISTDTIVIYKNGQYSRFRLQSPTEDANGYIERSNFFLNDIANSKTDSELCSDIMTYPDTRNLTDNDEKNGVSVNFDKDGETYKPFIKLEGMDTNSGYGDIVTIRFRANAGIKSDSSYETSVGDNGVLFTTAVLTRGNK